MYRHRFKRTRFRPKMFPPFCLIIMMRENSDAFWPGKHSFATGHVPYYPSMRAQRRCFIEGGGRGMR